MLLPVWQAEFGLYYVALAFLRSPYTRAPAALQMPASRLAPAWGARPRLVLKSGELRGGNECSASGSAGH